MLCCLYFSAHHYLKKFVKKGVLIHSLFLLLLWGAGGGDVAENYALVLY